MQQDDHGDDHEHHHHEEQNHYHGSYGTKDDDDYVVYDFKVLDLEDYFEDPASEKLEYSNQLRTRNRVL